MRNAIAVMNTKGGVGKSTLVLSLAETLSAQFHKNVLIIDSDAQASVSAMLLSSSNLHRLQSDGLTIVDLLVASVLNNVAVDWPRFVVGGVSDVDEARTVYLVPSDMQLTLFEREVSKESLHAQAAHQHRRAAQPRARRVRHRARRLSAGPLGADEVLAAGRRTSTSRRPSPTTCRPAGSRCSAASRASTPRWGLPRTSASSSTCAMRSRRWRPSTSAGSATIRRTAVRPDGAAHQRAAACGPAEPRGALLRRQVSRRVRARPFAPCARSS